MKTAFPEKFSFIDFTRLVNTDTDSTILAIIFADKKEAEGWNNLLLLEPYSFVYYQIETSPSKFVFKFTNHHSDYIFPVPEHIDESLLDLWKPYQLLVCLVQPGKSLLPLFDPHDMNPMSLS